MRIRILYVFLLYVLSSSINGQHDVLLEDYHLVTRQIAAHVNMYRSYGTVSVMFYPVSREVRDARFTFRSEILHLNTIGQCNPETIIVNLKNGAYPALNPDGYDFPKEFISSTRREQIHTLALQSGGMNISYSIEHPKPGIWYAVAYIKWEDPKTEAVKPHGLVPDCQTILYSDLQVKREENIELADCYAGIIIDYDQLPILFKCMSYDSVEAMSLNIKITKFADMEDQERTWVRTYPVCSKLKLVPFERSLKTVEASSIPTEDNNIFNCSFDPKANNVPVITFTPHPATWHYIQLGVLDSNASSLEDCESKLRTDFDVLPNNTISELVRYDQGLFFGFNYSLPSGDIKDSTSLINITSSELKTFRFEVNQFLDIGGSLVITAGLLANLNYSKKYQAEFKVKSMLTFNPDNQLFRAVICMDIGHPSVPLYNGQCKYNDKVKLALFVLNSTDSESIYGKTYIPYPDSGMWYLTLKIFCDNGTYYVPTLDSKRHSKVIASETTGVGNSECNATIMLKVSSMSCVNGKCSDHGKCLLKASGGLVLTFCSCSSGYGGWDCSDIRRMESRQHKMMAVLLLTLSNLFFLFSIYVAIIRYYYAEACMYFCTFVFSTFYHACDASPEVAYCITDGEILQFGDFYSGIMSLWVTMLAMSIVTDKFKASVHLIAGVVIALLLTWDMHSYICFLAPVVAGLVILFTSWYINYKKSRTMKYPRTYYLRYMLIGIMLVFIGCMCFIFWQTEQNYIFVHSIWHICIALSIVFLLPDTRRDTNGNIFKPSPNTCKFNILKYFRKSQSNVAPESQPVR